MWRKLLIRDEIYFMHCFMNLNSSFICILYGLNECWCETVSQNELQDRIKLLNKRILYNEYVKNALLNGDIECAILEQLPRGSHTRLLKLKYRVEECSLRSEWYVTKQSCKEFQQHFITPLLFTLDSLGQQVDVLKEIIKTKDEHLRQYCREGFKLQRKTLNTKQFNFDEFEKTFPVSRSVQNFNDLAKLVVTATTNHNIAKPETEAIIILHQSHGKSKRPKKRKRLEEQMKIEQRGNILNNKKVLQYESQCMEIATEIGSQGDCQLLHNSYKATNAIVKKKSHNITEESECKMVNYSQITNDDLKDEMYTKCIKLQSSNEVQSNEGNENSVVLQKETVLKELSLERSMVDLENSCYQLQIIKKELKELENLRVANLRRQEN